MSKTIGMADGDLLFTPSGQLLEIKDTDKGDQDFAEEFLTEYISAEDYGNDLFSLIGGSGIGVEHAIEAISSQKIRDVVQRLQAQQQADPFSTPDERIGGIMRLIVKSDPNSSVGNILFFIELMTESGEVIGNDKGFVVSLKQAEPSSRVAIDTLLKETPIPPKG